MKDQIPEWNSELDLVPVGGGNNVFFIIAYRSNLYFLYLNIFVDFA